MKHELYTIGHSNHTIEKFIELLKAHSITAVCDVRSTPYSQFAPQFNRESLQKELIKHKILYVFLGKELGARSDNPNCYINGKVQYKILAKEPTFSKGLNHLRSEMKDYRIALMCAEKDPITCHRAILVCRNLRAKDIDIKHILPDGKLESNSELERRLMKILKIPQNDLFTSREALIEHAYDKQGEKIAYVENTNNDPNQSMDSVEEKARA